MKKILHLLVVLGLFVALIAAAGCSKSSDDGAAAGQNSVVVSKSPLLDSTNCPGSALINGSYGISVEAGIDKNSNGILDAAEVTSTQYVCNGAAGATGATGATGADGATGATGGTGAAGVAAGVSMTAEPAGANCPNGGTKVSVGPDNNNDGAPDTVTSTDYVCNGADLNIGSVDAATFTFDDLRNIPLGGNIISASIAGNQPVVTFKVINKNTGEGIRGLRTFALHIAQLKPEASGSNSYWMNYITSASTSTGSFRPTADPVSQFSSGTGALTKQGYSVVDNNDGTYVVTFGSNIKSGATSAFGSTFYNPASVAYDAALPHRIVVGVRSVAVPGVAGKTPGAYAGPINPLNNTNIAQFTNTNGANFAYDFTPSTGVALAASARDIVTIDACNQCHYKLQYGSNNTSGHFGSRTDTKTCVMCHTPQNIVSGQTATTNADFTPLIHKIHMGAELPVAETQVGINLNEITYPQDIRNCTMCHKGAAVDNWKTKPTRTACGSCHNNVDFVSGANHTGGPYTDDTQCATCHNAANVAARHVAVEPVDPNNIFTVTALTGTTFASGSTSTANNNTNASCLAAAGAVPTGAVQITYVVSNVSTTSIGGFERPMIKFALISNPGGTVAFVTAATTTSELGIPNFVGSPSVYFAWSMPQDNSTAPADYNATASGYIKNIWNGSVNADASGSNDATITGPDADGYYTITLTGQRIAPEAKMLTGGVGYSYASGTTFPLTQTAGFTVTPSMVSGCTFSAMVIPFSTVSNNTTVTAYGGIGGLSVPAPNVWKVADNYTGRRLITSTAKCNSCHVKLGAAPTFHAGQRNDAQTCSFCHNTDRSNSGWPVNIKDDVHSIHAAAKRVNKFSWEATAGAKFWEVTYPGRGMLKNCEMCHIAGMYDFSNSAYTANNGELMNNLLFSTAATGTIRDDAYSIITGTETVVSTDSVISPFVTPGAVYGNGFSYSASSGVTTPAAATTLVISPISAACFACHDSPAVKSHMVLNGGSLYEARSTALAKTETCLTCHGPAANAVFGDTVPTAKIVHRWW